MCSSQNEVVLIKFKDENDAIEIGGKDEMIGMIFKKYNDANDLITIDEGKCQENGKNGGCVLTRNYTTTIGPLERRFKELR